MRIFRNSIFLILAVTLVNCGEEITRQNKFGLTEEDQKSIIMGFVMNTTYSNTGNGTVLDSSLGVEWKKCTQGQTFRSAGNDCQGTVSATYIPVNAQTYGAELKTYCNVNGHDCNSLSLPPTLKSPINNVTSEAYSSCADDRTAGQSDWRVPTYLELKKLAASGQNMLTTFFPNTVDEYYWSSWSDENDVTGKTAKAISFSGTNFGNEKSFNKDTRFYVRCVRTR